MPDEGAGGPGDCPGRQFEGEGFSHSKIILLRGAKFSLPGALETLGTALLTTTVFLCLRTFLLALHFLHNVYFFITLKILIK